MDDMEKELNCKIHGSGQPAYICQHLLANPVQHWFSELASVKNRCPDAWCEACEQQFQAHSGWIEEPERLNDIKVICQFCYEDIRAKSVLFCMGELEDSWRPFATECLRKLEKKQAVFRKRFKIDQHKRWDWDQGLGTLSFSNDGIPAVRAEFQFIGSICKKSETWLWAWANESLNPKAYEMLKQVQEFGDKSNYENLVVPIWNANEVDGWEMAAVAVDVLNAKGVYRTPNEFGFTYLAITHVKWVV